MAGELLNPDVLKIMAAVIAAAGYGVYRSGLIDRFRASQRDRELRIPPRKIVPIAKINFERVVLDICRIDHLQFIRTTATLRRMGFWIVGDFTIPMTKGTFFRAFVHDLEPIYAVLVQRDERGAPQPYIEFFTMFVDQTFLTDSSVEEDEDPKRPGALRFHRLPGLPPEELYQHHFANLEALRSNWLKTVPVSRDSFFLHYRQWLALDAGLRRVKEEDLRKDTLSKALDSLPALDIGPILRRYDVQRSPLEATAKPSATRDIPLEPASPTIIRDPERAPIRRRLGTQQPAPVADVHASASEAAISDPMIAGFESFRLSTPIETATSHPLDLLDHFDTTPTSAEAPTPTFIEEGGDSAPPLFDALDRLSTPDGFMSDPAPFEAPPRYIQPEDAANSQEDLPMPHEEHEWPVAVLDAMTQAEPQNAPERCPHCRARTLSSYSQKCHKCRADLSGTAEVS